MLDSLDTVIAFVVIMLVVSLLITIAVQMVAAALNLRGLNLAQGLKRTFAVIVPSSIDSASEQNAKNLANFILKGRFLSDSFLPDWPILRWWRHAQAIRPDEIFDAIQRIAIGKEPVGAENGAALADNARKILIALGVEPKTLDDAANRVGVAQQTTKDLSEVANQALEDLPEAVQAKVKGAVKTLTDQFAAAEQAAAAQLVKTAATFDEARTKFGGWTRVCEERVQQWFTMHTRIITVVFAFVFAFWLQLDAVAIFKLVSSNKSVRDKLVAQSAAISAQADKAIRNSPSIFEKAFSVWLNESDQSVKAAVGSLTVEPNDTRETLTGRLEAKLASLGDKKAAGLKAFNEKLDNTATDTLKDKAGDYAEVKADFDNTGFDLFPKNNGTRWGNSWSDGCTQHLWGILFSVGLLSLGAPFWYNSLKNLTSLRSTVAQNISKEQEQGQKQGDAPEPRASPVK
ncbi:MAG TPA: hypothetical protein VG103_13370 [Chthoniobacterales bacterium]|jgi:hypothetical protein|nr:hypothetical protein [Chthoniobacterales bacterium]